MAFKRKGGFKVGELIKQLRKYNKNMQLRFLIDKDMFDNGDRFVEIDNCTVGTREITEYRINSINDIVFDRVDGVVITPKKAS